MMKLALMVSFFATVTPDWHSPIADEIASRWAGPDAGVGVWRASANFVCQLHDSRGHFFLRFNHVTERTAQDYESEVAFVNYLANAGLRVARPVPSCTGKLVETVDTSLGQMVAVLFEALEGKLYETDQLSLGQFEAWGRAMGQMHAHTIGYTGPVRPSWRDHLAVAQRIIPPYETAAWQEMESVEHVLNQLPIEDSTFGLIHYDFEQDNLVWQDGTPGILDLDDCSRNWYAADVAYALRDLCGDRMPGIDPSQPEFQAFVRGYRTVRPIGDDELRRLPLFFRLYQLYALARMSRSIADELPASAPQWSKDLRDRLANRMAQQRDEFAAYPYQYDG